MKRINKAILFILFFVSISTVACAVAFPALEAITGREIEFLLDDDLVG